MVSTRAAALASLLALTACGARSSLVEGSTGSSSAGSGGAGGSRSVGGAFACPNLVWAGDPLSVSIPHAGTFARAPKIVAIDADTFVVTYTTAADPQGPAQALASFVVHDPFGAWPPAVGPADVVLPAPNGAVVSEGDAGKLAFALIQESSQFLLGETAPGGTWSALQQYLSVPGPLPFLSRSPDGAYLVGGGSKSQLTLHAFPAPGDSGPQSIFSGPGCVTSGMLGAAVPGATGTFLAASIFGSSAGCGPSDPPNPGTSVAVARLTVSPALLEQGAVIDATSPVTALGLAARSDGGAWVGYATEDANQSVYQVQPVDDQGALTGDPTVAVFAAPAPGAAALIDYDLASIGDTFAVARTVRTCPGLCLDSGLQLVVPDHGLLIGIDLGGLSGTSPSSAPAIAASTKTRSILVAYQDGFDLHVPLFTLLRADCVETP